jgi:hypothetical protein
MSEVFLCRYYDRLSAPRIISTQQVKKEEADNEDRLSEGKDFSKGERRIYRYRRPQREMACDSTYRRGRSLSWEYAEPLSFSEEAARPFQ